LKMQTGKYLFYQYDVGKAPVGEELSATVWLKANRPGLQVMARVILPHERDPANLESPLTTMILGDIYQNAGRWQRIGIPHPQALLKVQQGLMQNKNGGKAIDVTDAFIDALILNTYAGPGPTELWIDDLEVGPVLNAPVPPRQASAATIAGTPVARTTPSNNPSTAARPPVEFNGNWPMVGGRPFFMRGIRVTDTPLKVLHAAGFNTVFLEANADPALYKEAADLGLWIVPHLPVLSDDPRYNTPENLTREAQKLSDMDGVLFLHLGRTLTYEQVGAMQRATQLLRQNDPTRALGGDVWDGLAQHSRSLDITEVHRWPLMTALELPRYRDWVDMRHRLMHQGTFTYSWIQTHVPDWETQLLYNQAANQPFAEPVGPQPEQIRLLVYSAIANGSKGIAFWSDRFLADSHLGRDRLLMAATINQEIEMLEPILAEVNEAPQWIDTKRPDVKAAILRSAKGVLVLPIWLGKGAQFVPGQAAVAKLTINVPQVPASMRAWEILPGEVRSLPAQRAVGGTEVVVPEFGLTTAVFFTSDTNLVARFQGQARTKRQLAAQWTYDMASYSFDKVTAVSQKLQTAGLHLTDETQLLADCKTRLDSAKGHWDSKLFGEAYREAMRAERPLRILMRSQWEKAIKDLDSPVSSPYAVSYFTLPKHLAMMEQVKALYPSPNVLPGGDFETVATDPALQWKVEEPTIDPVKMTPLRVKEITTGLEMKPGGVPSTAEKPHEGEQCAMLQIEPQNKALPPQALERSVLSLSSPLVKLPPGTLVRVSAWVRIPTAISASVDGALFYDTAGGEPLAIRLTDATKWKKYTLYRKVPASGQIGVTLALTGLGAVYFDDVRIEPLTSTVPPTSPTPGPSEPLTPVSGRQ
ncbi:MAG TPA: hypothetical protein VHR72_04950, partial [Gemmataceae bacterium]|nr:hypothetical protein [Gemmataceae bacterium]